MTNSLGNIFYDDFYNAKWSTKPGTVREITWSIENTQLILPSGENVTATASLDPHRNTIRNAFSIWDKELDSISFAESNNGNNADITLSATRLDGVGGSWGWWNYNWDGNKNITKATIRFDSADLHNGWLMTTAMHEIGNILGLGDIYSGNSIKSVQEDPFPEKFLGNELWEDDKALLSQIYPDTINVIHNGIVRNGTAGPDRLNGSFGDDTLTGYGGTDKINGKSGDDIIDAGLYGSKADKVKGGSGSDTFIIKEGYWTDIKDFSIVDDVLDLNGLANGLDWDYQDGKTYIWGEDGYEVARFKGYKNLDQANLV